MEPALTFYVRQLYQYDIERGKMEKKLIQMRVHERLEEEALKEEEEAQQEAMMYYPSQLRGCASNTWVVTGMIFYASFLLFLAFLGVWIIDIYHYGKGFGEHYVVIATGCISLLFSFICGISYCVANRTKPKEPATI
jgi:hypothetical protein